MQCVGADYGIVPPIEDFDDCVCNLLYAPVCGMDGKTYGNQCAMECEKVEKKSDGECGGNSQLNYISIFLNHNCKAHRILFIARGARSSINTFKTFVSF